LAVCNPTIISITVKLACKTIHTLNVACSLTIRRFSGHFPASVSI